MQVFDVKVDFQSKEFSRLHLLLFTKMTMTNLNLFQILKKYLTFENVVGILCSNITFLQFLCWTWTFQIVCLIMGIVTWVIQTKISLESLHWRITELSVPGHNFYFSLHACPDQMAVLTPPCCHSISNPVSVRDVGRVHSSGWRVGSTLEYKPFSFLLVFSPRSSDVC